MLLLSLILVACKKDEVECARSVAWEEGQAIFVEKTNDWNLGDIQATGTRISAVDFDVMGGQTYLFEKMAQQMILPQELVLLGFFEIQEQEVLRMLPNLLESERLEIQILEDQDR